MDGSPTAAPGESGKSKTVAFRRLFGFADRLDKVLMAVGSVGAVVNGLCMPYMTILFGELTDSFGQSGTGHDVVSAISKVRSSGHKC